MTDIYDIYYSTGGCPIVRGGSDVWVNYWIDNIAPKLKVKPILLIHNQKPSDGLAPNYNQVSPEPPQHFAVVEGMDEKVKEIDEKIEMAKATKKENYLTEDERLLINNFILKVKKIGRAHV